jgi:hypothetical protein
MNINYNGTMNNNGTINNNDYTNAKIDNRTYDNRHYGDEFNTTIDNPTGPVYVGKQTITKDTYKEPVTKKQEPVQSVKLSKKYDTTNKIYALGSRNHVAAYVDATNHYQMLNGRTNDEASLELLNCLINNIRDTGETCTIIIWKNLYDLMKNKQFKTDKANRYAEFIVRRVNQMKGQITIKHSDKACSEQERAIKDALWNLI